MRGMLAIVAGTGLGLIACSALGAGSAQTVEVGLNEYGVAPATTIIKAGKVTFTARNDGNEDHELEISNRAGRDIPDEAILGEAEDIGPGETKAFTVDLKPGTYELACRLQDTKANPPFNHYDRSMYTTVTVQ
ncbi:MAG: cupredoxin domain-containing protein [Chloroflexi bacterium]|nr:cupredoxin domain-containing protein [Chloroflexota bacterium]